MPTGYTAIIEDDEDGSVTLRQYALRCARAFGPCIMQREESLDEPPRPREVDDHYVQRVRDAVAGLVAAQRMTLEEALTATDADYERAVRSVAEINASHRARRERYARVRAQVESWRPPTPDHRGLKKYMLDQIDDSVWHLDPYDYVPERQSAEEYMTDRLERACREVDRARKDLEREKKTAADSVAWIAALVASLPSE